MSENKELTVQDTRTELDTVINIVYLTPENSEFGKLNEFLTLKTKLKAESGEIEEKEFQRIYLHRAFPFDMPSDYISVLDKDKKEIGLIKSIEDFDTDTAALLRKELERKYYSPVISKIHSIKERYGYSYWVVDTDAGKMNFTLQDTFRSILRAGAERIFIIDMDGNRYEIPDLTKLDFNSYKKIELYL
ncbi:MAG: DUF1854 domain-containing protein [Clostridiales bacterium]|jgi:hypothetical protein|nr:DUF1854 domain-containing protein [Clostridiales bacterium]